MPDHTYRTVYLLCPARVRTGGPEALHQLARVLRDFGQDARMVYLGDATPEEVSAGHVTFPIIKDPMPAEYAHYDIPSTFQIEDDPANAIVFPEIWPAVTRHFARLMPHMWWLSIDNGRRAIEAFGGVAAVHGKDWVHLCQSHYALSWLGKQGVHGLPLFDYTSPTHLAVPWNRGQERVNRILFPTRGRWFTSWLKRWAPDLPWQEISGFTPAQVQSLFLTSRLYVDFGSHPGKDRMPREAAVLGCCIMTGQRGAAGNAFDVPIPDRYKFRDSRLNIPRITTAIRAVLADYPNRIADFDVYRRMIAGERAEFMAQATRIFGGRLVPASLSESPPTASAPHAASPA